jgi:hypothetical protein
VQHLGVDEVRTVQVPVACQPLHEPRRWLARDQCCEYRGGVYYEHRSVAVPARTDGGHDRIAVGAAGARAGAL